MLVVYGVNGESDITFIFWPQGDVSILEQNFSLILMEMDSYFWQILEWEENIFKLLVIDSEQKKKAVQASVIVLNCTYAYVRMKEWKQLWLYS